MATAQQPQHSCSSVKTTSRATTDSIRCPTRISHPPMTTNTPIRLHLRLCPSPGNHQSHTLRSATVTNIYTQTAIKRLVPIDSTTCPKRPILPSGMAPVPQCMEDIMGIAVGVRLHHEYIIEPAVADKTGDKVYEAAANKNSKSWSWLETWGSICDRHQDGHRPYYGGICRAFQDPLFIFKLLLNKTTAHTHT